jgi:hypothetical protein
MKSYKISKHEVEKVEDEIVRQIITLEVTHEDGSATTHGKEVPIGFDVKEEAVSFAAELEKILQPVKETTKEEIVLTEKQKEIKSEEVEAKLAELTLEVEPEMV